MSVSVKIKSLFVVFLFCAVPVYAQMTQENIVEGLSLEQQAELHDMHTRIEAQKRALSKQEERAKPLLKKAEDRMHTKGEKLKELSRKQNYPLLKKMTNSFYREIVTLYKTKRWEELPEKIGNLKEFMREHKLPTDYRRAMDKKLKTIEQRIKAKAPAVKSAQKSKSSKPLKPAAAKPAAPDAAQNSYVETLSKSKKQLRAEREALNADFAARLDALYQKAVGLYENNEYLSSQEAFAQVERLSPGYKQTPKFLAQLNAKGRKVHSEELSRKKQEFAGDNREKLRRLEEEKKRLFVPVDEIYKQGIRFYNEKEYALAKEKFEQVDEIIPNYQKARDYLRKIEQEDNSDTPALNPSAPLFKPQNTIQRQRIINQALEKFSKHQH